MTLSFRLANKADKNNINRFYKQQHYSAKFKGLDRCFIAEDNKVIVACIIISQLVASNRQAFLHALVVAHQYQHQGIGKKLLHFSCQHINNLQAFESIICFCEPALIPFYQKAHFFLLDKAELNEVLLARFNAYQQHQPQLNIMGYK